MAGIDVADISKLSQEEVRDIGKLLHNDLIVVIRNQNQLSLRDEVEFCEKIGTVDKIPHDSDFDRHRRHTADYDQWNGVIRVTGELNRDGEPGMFPHKEELKWHIDQASANPRNCFLMLHAVRGTQGSVTGFINNIHTYNDLPDDIKQGCKDVKFHCGAEHGTYSPESYKFFRNHVNNTHKFDLVQQNASGQTGLYFPFNQIYDWDGDKGLFDLLKDHVTQDKYIYEHHWEDGDVVLLEQNLQLHKRYHFENITERLLHRVSFNDSKL